MGGAVDVAVGPAAVVTHGGLADGRAETDTMVWQDEATELRPLARSAFDAKGISSCVLIAESAHSLHMMFGSADAVLCWFSGLMPASFPRTRLHLSPALLGNVSCGWQVAMIHLQAWELLKDMSFS